MVPDQVFSCPRRRAEQRTADGQSSVGSIANSQQIKAKKGMHPRVPSATSQLLCEGPIAELPSRNHAFPFASSAE